MYRYGCNVEWGVRNGEWRHWQVSLSAELQIEDCRVPPRLVNFLQNEAWCCRSDFCALSGAEAKGRRQKAEGRRQIAEWGLTGWHFWSFARRMWKSILIAKLVDFARMD